MARATINGQDLYYEDSGGAGDVVIFSHGFLMDHEMFAPQVDALTAAGWRVITWDERGFGETEFDGAPFTYWDSASDCLGLLDHLGVDRAVLGGMSQGGFLSLRAALTAPDRVRALILIDTQAGAESEEAKEAYGPMGEMWLSVGPVDELAEAIAHLIIGDPDENARWIAKWQARPKELIAEPMQCLLDREDITERLGEIRCPALVIHGTNDEGIPMDLGEVLAAGLPGADEVVQIEGAAHAPNLTHPDPVNAAILPFLDGLPA